METKLDDLVKIKKTDSIEMYWSTEDKGVWIYYMNRGEIEDTIFIPESKVYQVKRGLISATQRFYRKHEPVHRH